MYYSLSYFCEVTGLYISQLLRCGYSHLKAHLDCLYCLARVLGTRLGCLYTCSLWAPHPLCNGWDWNSKKLYFPNALVCWFLLDSAIEKPSRKNQRQEEREFHFYIFQFLSASFQLKQTLGSKPSFFLFFKLGYNWYNIILISGVHVMKQHLYILQNDHNSKSS